MLLRSSVSYLLSLVLTTLLILSSPVHGASYSSSKRAVNVDNRVSLALHIIQAIDLLEAVVSLPTAQLEQFLNDNNSLAIRHAIDLLNDAARELNLKSQTPSRRHLEEEIPDDDDYYHSTFSDVKVAYDQDNETVVTVGQDVIVIIEHSASYYTTNSLLLVGCMLVGAVMSGLLMGVMTLDPLMLGVKARAGNTIEERRMAMKLVPFSQNKNLVLVSILLVNCAVNEALPVFFDALLDNPLLSVICSLTVVVLVGEILPSAYFTGRDQVRIAFRLIPILRLVIVGTYPISYPLAKLMDKYFHDGDERSGFKRGEISALVRIQYEERLASQRRHANAAMIQASLSDDGSQSSHVEPSSSFNILGPLNCMLEDPSYAGMCNDLPTCHEMENEIDDDDINKVEGALTLKTKKVGQAFTPLHQVVSVTSDTILDERKIVELYSKGYSRIPVFKQFGDGSNIGGICGILLTKQLILVRKEDKRLVSTLSLYRPPCFSPDTTFSDALNAIQSGTNSRKSSNMALVCTNPTLAMAALTQQKPVPVEAGVLGIITLENILEELIQEQIYDEKDRKINPAREKMKWVVAKWKVFTLRRRLAREQDQVDDDNPFNYIEMRELV